MEKKYLSKNQIEEMGTLLLQEYVNAGNTIVTNQEGMKTLKDLEMTDKYRDQIQEMMLKISQVKPPRKPVHKYPSNYTPPKSKNRKPKAKH